jgi:hypothetical protein
LLVFLLGEGKGSAKIRVTTLRKMKVKGQQVQMSGKGSAEATISLWVSVHAISFTSSVPHAATNFVDGWIYSRQQGGYKTMQ